MTTYSRRCAQDVLRCIQTGRDDGAKHDAQALEYMLNNQSIHPEQGVLCFLYNSDVVVLTWRVQYEYAVVTLNNINTII